ncbi:hypothetical protein BJ982_003056 [Sphaerisporangium siamense]|uniref:Phytanoyl-CoA dioxygenase n=1 Tax=Sphaerisporangium siamense TaxID=795645 RepID=A0A7W7G9M6_9ACTN|nr:hypothetical protein [Sphaerisporangium siamense]
MPKALDQSVIERLAELAARRLKAAEGAHLSRYAHHGSLLPLTVDDHPVPEILTSGALHGVFGALGFTDPRWISGYVIAKPPRSPGLWWHQDWWAWGHPRSYVAQPTQIFVMIYLEPTSRRNGCLRVIPGTHMRRHRLHDALLEPHTVEIEAEGPDSVCHAETSGEIDIEAAPGDLVIGDVRVIHATHSNETESMRTAIDLLFAPHFGTLPAEFRAHYVNQICLPPAGWWEEPGHPLRGTPLGAMLPTYSGPEVDPVEFCRRPRWPAGRQSARTS